ncbi:MAG: isochorismatase family cysteine hydrolase [Chloroflexota bacterium]
MSNVGRCADGRLNTQVALFGLKEQIMRREYTIPEWSSTISADSEMMLLVIDMQKLFITDKKSPWSDPDMLELVPNIKALNMGVGAKNSLFTLFRPPVDWQDEHKSWRTYYYYSQKVTTEFLGTEAMEVIDDFMAEVGNPATKIASKKTASAFASPEFNAMIEKADPLFLVICGIETDYCVLATALDALNRGYYVVIPLDACASSAATGQSNAEGIFKRFPEQLWVTDTKTFLEQIGAEHALILESVENL